MSAFVLNCGRVVKGDNLNSPEFSIKGYLRSFEYNNMKYISSYKTDSDPREYNYINEDCYFGKSVSKIDKYYSFTDEAKDGDEVLTSLLIITPLSGDNKWESVIRRKFTFYYNSEIHQFGKLPNLTSVFNVGTGIIEESAFSTDFALQMYNANWNILLSRNNYDLAFSMAHLCEYFDRITEEMFLSYLEEEWDFSALPNNWQDLFAFEMITSDNIEDSNIILPTPETRLMIEIQRLNSYRIDLINYRFKYLPRMEELYDVLNKLDRLYDMLIGLPSVTLRYLTVQEKLDLLEYIWKNKLEVDFDEDQQVADRLVVDIVLSTAFDPFLNEVRTNVDLFLFGLMNNVVIDVDGKKCLYERLYTNLETDLNVTVALKSISNMIVDYLGQEKLLQNAEKSKSAFALAVYELWKLSWYNPYVDGVYDPNSMGIRKRINIEDVNDDAIWEYETSQMDANEDPIMSAESLGHKFYYTRSKGYKMESNGNWFYSFSNYNKEASPLFLDYDPQGPFSMDTYLFDFDGPNGDIVIHKEYPIYPLYTSVGVIFIAHSTVVHGRYDLYQPIMLHNSSYVDSLPVVFWNSNTDNTNPEYLIPAFLMAHFDMAKQKEDIEKAVTIVIDIALTLTGVGAAKNLRHLRHLSKINNFKFLAASVEIGASLANTALEFVEGCNDSAYCKSLKTFLTILSLSSLGVQFLKTTKTADEIVEAANAASNPELLETSTGGLSDPILSLALVHGDRILEFIDYLSNNPELVLLHSRLIVRSEQFQKSFMNLYDHTLPNKLLNRIPADILTDSTKLDKFLESMKKLVNNGNKYLISNPELLAKFSKLDPIVQDFLKHLSDADFAGTLSKRIREMDDEMIQLLNDAPDIAKYVAGHKLPIPLSMADYTTFADQIRKIESSLAVPLKNSTMEMLGRWVSYSSNTLNLIYGVFRRGVNLNKNILKDFLDGGPLFNIIASKVGLTAEELSSYKIFTDLPLNTTGVGATFMKPDIALIKLNGAGDVIDIILIENKLSLFTLFSKQQKLGMKQIRDAIGDATMTTTYARNNVDRFGEVIYDVSNVNLLTIPTGTVLNINKARCFKIADHGLETVEEIINQAAQSIKSLLELPDSAF